jgi:hypothetical protein
MAAWRLKREEPGAAYLGLGVAVLGAMGYSAYLGGKMVYEHGVGVKPADGLRRGDSPELAPGQVGEFARAAVEDVERAVPHAVDDVRRGDVAPTLTGDGDAEKHGPGGPGDEPPSTRA